MEVRILIQSTPNPNALKFVLNMPVKNEGKVTYKSAAECENNPLAKAIFTVPNVREVYFFDNYITVTQDGNVDWEDIEDQIQRIITENAPNHDPNFKVTEAQKPSAPVSNDPDIAKINEILDRTIRPALQMDGGDLNVLGFDGQVVSVSYQGACGSCPSSTSGTLRAIEGILRDEFKPEITVESV
jgi:NFU1 iron-sulfur cluster scaffold homolog, mitochondrial